MTAIKLIGLTELKSRENLSAIPPLVQQHLDAGEKPQTEGQHFRIVRKHDMESVCNHGCAYFNELIVEKKTDGEWKKIYSTGRLKYRGAYASDVDDWSLNFVRVSLIEESATAVTYGVTDGERSVYVFRIDSIRSQLHQFDLKGYEKTAERIALLQKVLDDPEAFRAYAQNSRGNKWLGNDLLAFDKDGQKLANLADADLVVFPVVHADRDYDAIVDSYKVYVWLRGHGLGVAGPFRTGLRHPSGRFYFVDVGFDVGVTVEDPTHLPALTVVAKNNGQRWEAKHDFSLEKS